MHRPWGDNTYGQLGTGLGTTGKALAASETPTQVSDSESNGYLSNIIKIVQSSPVVKSPLEAVRVISSTLLVRSELLWSRLV